ncbi:MAG: HlyD family efflux transporter periplasmic adaptor subunit [Rhodocyclaceae bacterium]|nr:HlyD family efflux transporter periplasmic adaptor subunit [Rhodocyclaceae bacterium]
MKPARLFSTLALAVALANAPALAHDGHDHDHGDAAAAHGSGPKRQPDGSVFLPKPAQRQLGVRTQPAVAGELPRSFELAGKVVMDPNAGGKVQAMVAGRVTAAAGGFPLPGQPVKKGQVLAWVTPEAGGGERSLAEARLRRLRELADTVPRKTIEEAEAAVANEQLRAPVSGVVAAANVVAGQVVEARETLFEIVDPRRLLVEAVAFAPVDAADVAGAAIVVGERRVPLALLGVARVLREQALPLVFRAEGEALAALAVGQPVRVVVSTRRTVAGIAVPAQALMKSPANQTVVWVKTAPERFAPRPVTFEPLDGVNVAVTSGLKAGERVVVRGATLINQIR